MTTTDPLATVNNSAPKRYYGKYRGTVLNNVDPMQIGRIQAIVPDVSAVIPTSWAMPCAPVGGLQMGMVTVPLIGAGVWIEFEQGDPDYPIWSGCFWGSAAEVPVLSHLAPPVVPAITFQTPLQNGIIISDVPGFKAYYVVYAPDDTVTAISIFDNAAGAEESNRRGLAWIKANLEPLLVGPATAVAGPVVVHTLA